MADSSLWSLRWLQQWRRQSGSGSFNGGGGGFHGGYVSGGGGVNSRGGGDSICLMWQIDVPRE